MKEGLSSALVATPGKEKTVVHGVAGGNTQSLSYPSYSHVEARGKSGPTTYIWEGHFKL